MSKEEIIFQYKPSLKKSILALLFFFSMLLFIVYELTNEAYIRNNSAEVFFLWFALLFLSVSVTIFSIALYRTIFINQFIVLGDDYINSPKSMITKQKVFIKFNDVKKIHVETLGIQKSLVITSKENRLVISEILLKDKGDFNELVKLVVHRVAIIKKGESGVHPQE